MPSTSLRRFCSAAACCVNSPTADRSNDLSPNLNGDGGERTASTNAVSSSSSSRSALACDFSLLASLKPPAPSSSAALAISRHSAPLLCAASELEVVLYDLTDLRKVASAAGRGSGSVKSARFSADGGRVFTAHQDCRIRVWSTSPSTDGRRRLRLVATLPTPSDFLRHLAFPKNYVPIRRHKRTLWINHADAVSSLATHGDLLCSASWDKTIKVWRVASSGGLRCLESVPAHDDAVNAVAVAPDGVVYSASADSQIKVWRRPPVPPGNRRKKRRKLELAATLEKHSSAVNALALSPDGSVLYSGGCDGSVVAWEGGATAVLRGHEKSVMCLAAVDDLVVSGSSDRALRVWRSAEGGPRCVAVLTGHRKGVTSVAACRVNRESNSSNPAAYVVCSGSAEGEVRIWSVWVNR